MLRCDVLSAPPAWMEDLGSCEKWSTDLPKAKIYQWNSNVWTLLVPSRSPWTAFFLICWAPRRREEMEEKCAQITQTSYLKMHPSPLLGLPTSDYEDSPCFFWSLAAKRPVWFPMGVILFYSWGFLKPMATLKGFPALSQPSIVVVVRKWLFLVICWMLLLSELVCLRFCGSAFQSFGTRKAKDLPPLLVLIIGAANSYWVLERRVLVGL